MLWCAKRTGVLVLCLSCTGWFCWGQSIGPPNQTVSANQVISIRRPSPRKLQLFIAKQDTAPQHHRAYHPFRANKKQHYTLQISSRLGRDRYKEQFMFLYRDDLVDLVGSWQYEDNQVGDVDAFAREPYILRFKCLNTVLEDLVLIPVHTKPDDSMKELDELYDVFLEVTKKWKTDNVMILGDFNADGSYLSKKGMKAIRIRSDKNFHWLIEDDVDTTANTGNDNTYDRIVIYGDDMLDAVVPNSAKPFNFQIEYGLSEEDALKVSDHYPVEVELKRKTPTEQSSATGK
ncbi:deoxyribonuclease gamma isoform X1 [Oncorhynchus tshawytscha]|uniref:deoxyribonuclease gamma isoform X1 n=1 Tax=Oncorhynchus tshawytscha TaxID=74940 RepID=UPI001C3E56CE|nr:deoxyribonuclease gamma isoform X1 [Oncorhynchus tshawytscha]